MSPAWLPSRGSANNRVASFVGFAPVEEPRLVVGVFLDEPQTNYRGSSEAAPLFGRIASLTFGRPV